ncbi:MAG: hypothetical protein ACFFG0_00020 [Candidatus Thorarchaeota archaeon]
MASPIPTQERIVDPFASYNSNVVNKITQLITQDSNGLLTTNSLQVSLDSTSPVNTVVVSTGYAVKDDVLIHVTQEHQVDLTDTDNYVGTPLITAGYYYLVLDYTYAKSKPAPQASIKVLTPNEIAAGAYSLGGQYLLLKIIQLSIPSGIQIDNLLDYDPSDSTVTREYLKYYAGTEYSIPTFSATRDQSRMVYESNRDKFYFGYKNGWGELSAGGVAVDINTDSTGVAAGNLCYVDENRDATLAIATSVDTCSDMVVLSVGTAASGAGRASIAGFVEDVPVETGVLIDVGDILYLSENEAGTVTNVQTFPVFQVVGRSLSQGSSTTPIDMIYSPKVPLAVNMEGQITSWVGPDGNDYYYHDINVSGLDGTNAFICSWFDNSNGKQIIPVDVEIRNVGNIVRIYINDNTSVIDYIISSGSIGTITGGGSGGSGVSDHALLTSLDFASSGHIGFAPSPHGNAHHSSTFITTTSVTYEALNTNGDIGTGATQVAQGNHTHSEYDDVPTGEIILFESDTAVTGYSLLTTLDDALVYITKGSGAAGEAGGSLKSGSTWTQPSHTHSITTQSGHTHSTTFPNSGWSASFPITQDQPAANNTGTNTKQLGSRALTSSSSGSHDHGGASGSSATANTWRPRGYNYTRQQRT